MKPTIAILTILTILLTLHAAQADWSQPFRFFWPEQVPVKFEGTWSPEQKRIALRCLEARPRCPVSAR